MFYKLTELTPLNCKLITKGLINKFPYIPKLRDREQVGGAGTNHVFIPHKDHPSAACPL